MVIWNKEVNMMYFEMDEHGNFLRDRLAVTKKIDYVCAVRKGQFPYFPGGLPISEFTYSSIDKAVGYIKDELKRDNIDTNITFENGRFTFVDIGATYSLEG
jgi:hypothetical protein